jgi:hypothetical protein
MGVAVRARYWRKRQSPSHRDGWGGPGNSGLDRGSLPPPFPGSPGVSTSVFRPLLLLLASDGSMVAPVANLPPLAPKTVAIQ